MAVDVIFNGHDEFFDIPEYTTAKPVLGQVAKETLDHVEPGTAGGSEVYMESFMTREPLLNPLMLVRRVVVRDRLG